MAAINITDQSDIKLVVPITNKDTGAAINLNNVEGVAIHVFQGEKSVLARFSMHPVSGYDHVNFKEENYAEGKAKIMLHKEVLQKGVPGPIYLRAEVQTTDADFSGSSANVESERVHFATLVKSSSKGSNLKNA